MFPDKSRSSHQRCSVKNSVFRNFVKFTKKHLCQNLSFNKVTGLKPRASLLFKERFWHRCFPVNFAKFIRTSFFNRTPLGDYFCKSLSRLGSICFIFIFFFIAMHEVDTVAEVNPFKPFQNLFKNL